MVRYFVPLLVVALCFACAGASGRQEQEQQQKDLVTGVAIVKSDVPNRLSKVPKTVRWGMTPEEAKKAREEMAKEEEMARQQFRTESKKAEETVNKSQEELKSAEKKLKDARAEYAKATNGSCGSGAAKDVPPQSFRAEVDADSNAVCSLDKVKERREKLANVKAAEEAFQEAEQVLKVAQAMDTAAKTAVRNSEYIPVHTAPLGDGRSNIGRSSAGMGQRPTDGARWPTVMVNVVLLLLIAEALIH